MKLPGSDLLLYGGIAVMAAALVITVIGITIFSLTGHNLKEKLEREYGKPPVSRK